MVSAAAAMWRELLPAAQHVYVDTCEGHGGEPAVAEFVALVNDRRFVVLDLLLGHDLDLRRPFLADLVRVGGEDLLGLPPMSVDVLGLDYYPHPEWYFTRAGGTVPSPFPQGLCTLILEHAERYRLPLWLTETNIRGTSADRASWLKHTLEECERAALAGAPLTAYCWFPTIDSCDWDSLLARADGHIDPVGVFWLDERARRRPSSMSRSFAAAAAGASAAELPAFRFCARLREQVCGLLPRMTHWDWLDSPATEPPLPPGVHTLLLTP